MSSYGIFFWAKLIPKLVEVEYGRTVRRDWLMWNAANRNQDVQEVADYHVWQFFLLCTYFQAANYAHSL